MQICQVLRCEIITTVIAAAGGGAGAGATWPVPVKNFPVVWEGQARRRCQGCSHTWDVHQVLSTQKYMNHVCGKGGLSLRWHSGAAALLFDCHLAPLALMVALGSQCLCGPRGHVGAVLSQHSNFSSHS